MINTMTKSELREKIKELDDHFLAYAYVKRLEELNKEEKRISESIKKSGSDAKCGHHGNLLHGKPCLTCFPEFDE